MLMPKVRFSLANRDFPFSIRQLSTTIARGYQGDPDKVTVVEALSVACVDFSAVGVARGLAFLHSSTEIGAPIVHRDFKSTNILLNDNYEAKISDFRLAKFMPDGHENCVTATVLGTFGYFDPKYKLACLMQFLLTSKYQQGKNPNPVFHDPVSIQKEIPPSAVQDKYTKVKILTLKDLVLQYTKRQKAQVI